MHRNTEARAILEETLEVAVHLRVLGRLSDDDYRFERKYAEGLLAGLDGSERRPSGLVVIPEFLQDELDWLKQVRDGNREYSTGSWGT